MWEGFSVSLNVVSEEEAGLECLVLNILITSLS